MHYRHRLCSNREPAKIQGYVDITVLFNPLSPGQKHVNPDSKAHGANMGPIWGRQDPGGPHVGPMNLAIWDYTQNAGRFSRNLVTKRLRVDQETHLLTWISNHTLSNVQCEIAYPLSNFNNGAMGVIKLLIHAGIKF